MDKVIDKNGVTGVLVSFWDFVFAFFGRVVNARVVGVAGVDIVVSVLEFVHQDSLIGEASWGEIGKYLDENGGAFKIAVESSGNGDGWDDEGHDGCDHFDFFAETCDYATKRSSREETTEIDKEVEREPIWGDMWVVVERE